MKNVMVMALVLANLVSFGQDKEERIQRDIEVAENVLSTLIRQQMDRKSFWSTEVRGSYTPGYGVTLRIPSENFPFGFQFSTEDFRGPAVWAPEEGDVVIRSGGGNTTVERRKSREELDESKTDKEKLKLKKTVERDSARAAYTEKLLQASKTFLADYGDLISIEPNEKILITTKSERGGNHSYSFAGVVDIKLPKRRVLSVEAVKSDLTQYKQNKITRDQLMAKFKVVNSELSDDVQPDLELISTIFSRLYRSDLSKTYFMEGAPYYERMNGFGVTYFMQVYSSNIGDFNRFTMPTLDLEDVDQATRDKKVKELYPIFEKDLKDNMLEYGRTISSLKDDELVIFDVTLTKCKGCGIPASIELSVKASVLKDFGSGKISKDAALGKVNVKKGVAQ
jgi:hypothetical protein